MVDYARELAFLSDLTELIPTKLDYGGGNVVSSAHDEKQQVKLIALLTKHQQIIILSGNALPPPAYGVVCDVDVNEHDPIQQRARRVPLQHLTKMYRSLKGLLRQGSFSSLRVRGSHQL